ncbi:MULTISPECIES: hypothetical protein [Aminobacterium]|jgi:hypothetical protein|uniref:Uncharacterized protein n=1 Tax=Aminobacterium colombiense (strain DSM 12261 / ALA-1) TaxID=572547 RepID=D5EG88_AMICL|nr:MULTISPECIES: hypothetical protein [Aminobacterium]MDD2379704.1 hypothetical protein [Aminobacterium colombiense]ADE57570.1 hypothetical protein Amico_1453 [Aminobacterium colombiense DSM 12261]MDD3768257.1 hypothetical protein [Aminobacterium colombiense]MDD4265648.1 hypothetical protein [Aminobacterium colombiense]MDD4585884.1 hypothetical protein [Aminobacterium colombiense]
MVDMSFLDKSMDLWTYWGFEPWSYKQMKGVSRKITFVKDSFLGEVGRYYAYDYVVWAHQGVRDAADIFSTWKPLPDVMTQRFLFIEQIPTFKKKVKTFFWGFRGFLEVYSYVPGAVWDPKIKDLAPLVNKAKDMVNSQTWG